MNFYTLVGPTSKPKIDLFLDGEAQKLRELMDRRKVVELTKTDCGISKITLIIVFSSPFRHFKV